MFDQLEELCFRPKPFEVYTAEDLWTENYTSKKMLEFHLDDSINLSSRSKDFIEQSVKWIVSHFEIKQGFRIADFGCGPGLYTTLFAEYDADVIGIDFSQRSIEYAQNTADQKGLSISYFKQNYLNFVTENKFDLITMIFCDFCALSPDQRERLLKKFYMFLRPGGSVLLDVYSLNEFNCKNESNTYEFNQMDHFWSAENYYAFLNSFKYVDEKVTLDKFTIFEKDRSRVIYNWLQYFSRDSLQREFDAIGFESFDFYSDVAGTPFSTGSREIAVIARKPEGKLDK